MIKGAQVALEWVADRFAGKPAAPNCDQLPTAHTP
jgi:hypothetical protein